MGLVDNEMSDMTTYKRSAVSDETSFGHLLLLPMVNDSAEVSLEMLSTCIEQSFN